jgi:hypothetical protein
MISEPWYFASATTLSINGLIATLSITTLYAECHGAILQSVVKLNVVSLGVPMGLYHPLDGITNLKYKLLYFSTPNKKVFKEKGTSFEPG